ncbi:MAG: hypothetical protein HeimC3_22420 [Candidatus Heimdallarchaeota archaeon LC_3]|nr:MAG: hypothetical protein HeimC3_22420 [Candidatus Heimdallarchaeota archaeon LC_3]
MNLRLFLINFLECPKNDGNSILFDFWNFPSGNQKLTKFLRQIGYLFFFAFFVNGILLINSIFILENSFDISSFLNFLTWDISLDEKRRLIFYMLAIPMVTILNIAYPLYFIKKLYSFQGKPHQPINDLHINWERAKEKFDSFKIPSSAIPFVGLSFWWLEFSILVNISTDTFWILIYVIPPLLVIIFFTFLIFWRIYQRKILKTRLKKYYINLINQVSTNNKKSDYTYLKVILNDLDKISIINTKKYLFFLIFPIYTYINPILDVIRIFTF